MENYEKKYKEALEVIKDNLDALNEITETGANVVNIQSIKNCFYRAFPEIKEPEDNRMRKALIKILNEIVINTNYKELGIDYGIKDIITWLKKQGGQKIDIPKWKYKKDNTPLLRDSIILNKYGCVAKSPSGAIISDAWVLDYDELAKLPKEEVEKQEEKAGNSDKVEAKDYRSIDPFFFKTIDVEKETDFKLELDFDFSVGQWIVACGKKVFRITKIDGFNVTLVDTNGDEYVFDVSSLKDARLWTIQDAKDGDILSTLAGAFIYNGNNGGGSCPGCYCGIDTLGNFKTGTKHHWTTKPVFPATKEQHDALFTKMREAGYEWDTEKKELKKIESNPAWSEEDDYNLQCMIAKVTSDIQKGNIGRNQELMDWLKSLKDRVQPHPRRECSKEDKVMLDEIIDFFENGTVKFQHDLSLYASWLKSLKQKIGG